MGSFSNISKIDLRSLGLSAPRQRRSLVASVGSAGLICFVNRPFTIKVHNLLIVIARDRTAMVRRAEVGGRETF